jgi:hypothetical protein
MSAQCPVCPKADRAGRFTSSRSNSRKAYLRNYMREYMRRTSGCLQNTGGSRMRPMAKYLARSCAIHRKQIKAASRTATMYAPINA